MSHLHMLIENRSWSLQAELERPPHSPDLTPLNFFCDAATGEVHEGSLALFDSWNKLLKHSLWVFQQTDAVVQLRIFAVCINVCAMGPILKTWIIRILVRFSASWCISQNNEMFPTELLWIFDFISFTFCLIKFFKSERIVKHPVVQLFAFASVDLDSNFGWDRPKIE